MISTMSGCYGRFQQLAEKFCLPEREPCCMDSTYGAMFSFKDQSRNACLPYAVLQEHDVFNFAMQSCRIRAIIDPVSVIASKVFAICDVALPFIKTQASEWVNASKDAGRDTARQNSHLDRPRPQSVLRILRSTLPARSQSVCALFRCSGQVVTGTKQYVASTAAIRRSTSECILLLFNSSLRTASRPNGLNVVLTDLDQ